MAMMPPKKGGLDVVIGVAKPKPMQGGPGAMKDAADDMPQDEPDGDVKACVKRCESMLKKIADVLGVEPDEEMPEDGA